MKIAKNLTWKQTGLINLGIFLVAATILGVRVSQLPTQVTPKAAAPAPTPLPIPITQPPRLQSIKPTFSKPGDVIRITGVNLGSFPEGTQLTIANQLIASSNINSWTPTYIDLTIPEIPTNQVTTLSLNSNNFPITTIPLVIYDPGKSLELGLLKSGDSYQLWAAQSQPGTQINLVLENTPSQIQSIATDINSNPNIYQYQLNSSQKTILLTSTTEPQIKNIQITSRSGDKLPFFVHPLNQLIRQFE